MTIRFILILLLGSFLVSGCYENVKTNAGYYPIDSLISVQIKYLTSSKASIEKVAFLDEKPARSSFTPKDSVAWEKELEPFSFLTVINKPINKGLYLVENGVRDAKSNLNIKSFAGKNGLPVEYLKVFYEGGISNLRRLEAKYHESNLMYKGTRFLVMEFQDIRNTPTLVHYSLVGGQKMFLGDTVKYSIEAQVSLPN
jgi:hypothetical protein